jgi:putative ABC transport system permease protein
MLRNYLKIAWRNLQRHKMDATINVVGLALGIACCVLLGLYVRSEWTYDQFHEKADRIVRVNRIPSSPGGDPSVQASTPAPLAAALVSTFPEVETAVRMNDRSISVTDGENQFRADALFADSTFFDTFTFPMRRGNPQTALRTPKGVVLSAPTARKYFGQTDPMGKSLTIEIEETRLQVEVTGVVGAPPSRSSIQFDLLLPFALYKYSFSGMIREVAMSRWDFPVGATFAVLQHSDQREALTGELEALAAKHYGDTAPTASDGMKVMGSDTGDRGVRLSLQPLTAIHLQPEVVPVALTAPSDPVYSYLMAGAALLVLLIGGINFTTLALGRSAGRAKEVGVRKALGARRKQVRGQFWGEALLTSGAALLLGLGLAGLALPTFNQVVGTDLSFTLTPTLGAALLGLGLLLGLIAGSYPALVLSRFEAASILRGESQLGGRSWLIRGLVVVQFVLSMGLVAGSFIMSEQLDFMRNNLGFRSDRLIRISGFSDTESGAELYEPFRREATRHPGVEQIAASTVSFFSGDGLEAPLALGDTAEVGASVLPVDSTFQKTLGIRLVEGRSLSAQRSGKETGVLVNQSLVRALGWTAPVGKTLRLSNSSMIGKALGTATVIGVVENFHTQSMRHRVQPMMLVPNTVFGGGVGSIYVRVAGDRLGPTLNALRGTWKTVAPDQTFEYSFLDEVVGAAYQTERRQRAIVRVAGGLALLIACFGLFGLAALAVAQRRTEVGIRKALGASATAIVGLFTKDILKLAAGAVVIAVPLTYWGAQQWLQNFAYRIDLEPGVFVVAGGLVGAVALLTVGVQAFRAARIDPATTLRDE